MNDERDPKWDKVSEALRHTGVAERPEGEDLSAPHGFAARVVARQLADHRADSEGLSLWRRWSLAGAACAVVLFGAAFFVKPAELPPEPFLPVPELENFQL